MIPMTTHTIAINIYNGNWTMLADLRLLEATDQELQLMEENHKLAIDVAANFGKRFEIPTKVDPPVQPIRCDYCGQAAIINKANELVHLIPMLEPCDAP